MIIVILKSYMYSPTLKFPTFEVRFCHFSSEESGNTVTPTPKQHLYRSIATAEQYFITVVRALVLETYTA